MYMDASVEPSKYFNSTRQKRENPRGHTRDGGRVTLKPSSIVDRRQLERRLSVAFFACLERLVVCLRAKLWDLCDVIVLHAE